MPLFVPAMLLGMLVVFHRVLAIFGPSLLYLAYRDYRRRQESIPTGRNVLATAAALCCVPLSAALFLGLSGIGLEAYIGQTGGGEFLPLFEQPGFYAQYRIFSLTHLMDFVNQHLLSAPAACMAIFLVRKRHLGRHTFLAICTVVPLFFTFIAKANIGAFRDWDILSLPALPFTLWAATAFVERIRAREQLFHGAFLICGAAALHTLLWIGVNASAEPAEARFTNQLGRLTGHANASGWLALAKFHRKQNNPSAALNAYKRALDADPSNPNRWLTVGIAYRKIGRTASAIEHFQKAVELQPDLPVPYMNLGAAYSDMGQFDKAIEYTRKAIALQPDLAKAHMNLGAVYWKTGEHEKTIEALEDATALRPRHATTIVNLGVIYKSQGKYSLAVENFTKALQLQKGRGNATSYLYVGDTYYDMGEHEKAVPYFQKAIQLNPNHANAHLLLGLTYRALKRGEEARAQFVKTLKLEPDHPQATQIRQWLAQTRK